MFGLCSGTGSAFAHVLNLQIGIRGLERLDEGLPRAQELVDLAIDHVVALLVAQAGADGEGEVGVAGRVRDGDGEGAPQQPLVVWLQLVGVGGAEGGETVNVVARAWLEVSLGLGLGLGTGPGLRGRGPGRGPGRVLGLRLGRCRRARL